jgi:hypothetical protein
MLKTAILVVAAATSGIIAFSAPPVPKPMCEVAEEWVHAHRESLPKTSHELAKFERLHQKAIMKALSPQERQNIWEEHLAEFLRRHPELSTEQVAFVLTVVANLPVYEAMKPNDPRLKESRDAAVEVFGKA